jgi:hypothetical protein
VSKLGIIGARGLAAGPSFVDTGDGLAPDNFQSLCCTGFLGMQPDASHLLACNNFKAANPSIFGDCFLGPCSECAAAALSYSPLPARIVPPAPPVDWGTGAAIVPLVACPVEVSPCPCDGRPVLTAQDADDLITCQALAQAAAQNTDNRAAAAGILAAQCAAMKMQCAGNLFSSPNADCSACTFDPLKGGSLVAIAAGLLLGAVLLNKLL